jgi:hypothetical protein
MTKICKNEPSAELGKSHEWFPETILYPSNLKEQFLKRAVMQHASATRTFFHEYPGYFPSERSI